MNGRNYIENGKNNWKVWPTNLNAINVRLERIIKKFFETHITIWYCVSTSIWLRTYTIYFFLQTYHVSRHRKSIGNVTIVKAIFFFLPNCVTAFDKTASLLLRHNESTLAFSTPRVPQSRVYLYYVNRVKVPNHFLWCLSYYRNPTP